MKSQNSYASMVATSDMGTHSNDDDAPKRRLSRPVLVAAALGCLVLGFVCWMLGLGNASPRESAHFGYWLSMAGLVLILLGDVGLVSIMESFSRAWSRPKRLGAFVLVAALLSFLSFLIFSMEMALNFGDSDLPPYRPDTPFEKATDFALFTVLIGAALLWLFVIVDGVVVLSRAIKGRITPDAKRSA
jgi:hypothetical protein